MIMARSRSVTRCKPRGGPQDSEKGELSGSRGRVGLWTRGKETWERGEKRVAWGTHGLRRRSFITRRESNKKGIDKWGVAGGERGATPGSENKSHADKTNKAKKAGSNGQGKDCLAQLAFRRKENKERLLARDNQKLCGAQREKKTWCTRTRLQSGGTHREPKPMEHARK